VGGRWFVASSAVVMEVVTFGSRMGRSVMVVVLFK